MALPPALPKSPAKGLSPETRAKLEAMGVAFKPWDPAELEALLEGHRTLAELTGFSKERQFQLAATGVKLLQDGLRDKAKDIFLGLEALDPYDAYFQVCLGTIALEDGDDEEAEARFTHALFINPASVPALAYRGELRLKLGRRQEGVDDLVACLERDPKGLQEVTARAKTLIEAAKKAK